MRMAAQYYRFGHFSVAVATRELREGNAPIELPARAFDCLVYLIEHRERAVGRDELIAAVWGRADVSEALLNHTILKIRRVLGADGPSLIRTVPRFGYRWAGALESGDTPRRDDASDAVPVVDAIAPANARSDSSRVPRSWLIVSSVLLVTAIVVATVITFRHGQPTPDADTKAVEPDRKSVV